jgi:hypothetical protein
MVKSEHSCSWRRRFAQTLRGVRKQEETLGLEDQLSPSCGLHLWPARNCGTCQIFNGCFKLALNGTLLHNDAIHARRCIMACYELLFAADLLTSESVQELVTTVGTFGTNAALEHTRQALHCAGVIDSPLTKV